MEGPTSPDGALKFRRVDRRPAAPRMMDLEAPIGAEHQAGLDLLPGDLPGLLEHAGCLSLERVVVDGGLANRDTIVACAAQRTDPIGSLPDPAERSAAAMKPAGIDPAFAPGHFVRQTECRGPA